LKNFDSAPLLEGLVKRAEVKTYEVNIFGLKVS